MTALLRASALRRAIDDPPRVAGVGALSPVAGLARRSVGFIDVLAQSVSAVAPSAAVTTIPIMVAAVAGSATVWAIAAAMLLCLVVASTVNQFTRRISATGSLYTFVAKGLGTGASFMTGVAMLIGYAFIAMFALAGAGLYLSFLIGEFWPAAAASGLVVSILLLAIAGLCFVVLARGIRLSTRVTLLVESVSVVIIIVLIVALLAAGPPGISLTALGIGAADGGLSSTTFGEFATGAVVAITAFVGFESAATLGVEARRPFASIPRAISWTVIVAGVLYLFGTYSQLVGFEVLGTDITQSTSPVNDLAAAFGIDWVAILLDASIATSFVACAVASTTALSRVLFAMGREGLIPPVFGRASVKHHTPIIAIAVTMPILAAVPIALISLGSTAWQAMGLLIVGAAGGYITAYIFVCVAAPVFLWRIGELTLWPTVRAAVGAVSLTVVLVVYLITEGSTSRGAGVWVFLGVMATGLAAFAWVRARKPWLHHTIGIFDETITADVLGGEALGGEAATSP